MNTLILNTIEVVDVPEVALAAAEDLEDTRERLAELVDWMSESCAEQALRPRHDDDLRGLRRQPARSAPATRMECKVCWYVYDPAEGDVVWQIPPGTPFAAAAAALDAAPTARPPRTSSWCCPMT